MTPKQLREVEQELCRTNERLGDLSATVPQSDPLWDETFEDLGAAHYYIQEAIYRIRAVIGKLEESKQRFQS